MLAPELGELLTTHLIKRCGLYLRSTTRVKPCEAVYMRAPTALEFVSRPIVCDAKLRLKDIFEKRAKSQVEMPGCDMGTILEVSTIDLITMSMVGLFPSQMNLATLIRNV